MSAAIPSVVQLERAIKIAQKIQKLETELTAIIGQSRLPLGNEKDHPTPKFTGKRKYTFSAETLAKRGLKSDAEASDLSATPSKKRGNMSEQGRAAIVAAQKARWAKTKSAKSTK